MLVLNSEMMIAENAPIRLLSSQLEELEYRKLYEAYSPKRRKSAADPRALFKENPLQNFSFLQRFL